MNNPADTLAALAADIERAGQTAPFILDNTAFAISPSEIDGWVSRLRALASLKGEAVACETCGRSVLAVNAPCTGWLTKCGKRLVRLEECGTADDLCRSSDTAPPPQPEPQPATGGEFCLICDMPSGEMAYCSTCASVGIAEAWVNRPGQSKTTPPAPQAGTAVGRLAHLLDELAKLFPEAVDPLASDPPELRYLEAIRALATQPQQAPTPSPAPQGGGEALRRGVQSLLDLYSAAEASDEPQTEHDLGYEQACAEFAQHLSRLLATPPAQQPGEGGEEVSPLLAYSVEFMNGWMQDEADEARRNWQRVRDAALAPKEKGNG